MRVEAERRAMHHGDARALQQVARVVLAVGDDGAAGGAAADRAGAAGVEVERALRDAAGEAGGGVQRGGDAVAARLERGVARGEEAVVAVERGDGGGLADRGGVGGALRLEFGHGADQRLRPAGEADAPAGHGVGFGDSVDGEGAVVQLRRDLGDGREGEIVMDDLFVDVVGHDVDVGMADEYLGEGAQFGGGVGGAGGVGRRVEDEPFGARGDRRLQRLRRDAEPRLGRRVDEDGFAAGDSRHVGVGDPVGPGDYHLVAAVHGGEHGVEEHLLAAGSDDDLLRRVVEAVVAPEFVGDGALEFGGAVDAGVFGVSGADGGDGRLLDVVGGVEVGLPGAEAEDVLSGGLEFGGARGDRHGGRRLHAVHPVCEQAHRAVPVGGRPAEATPGAGAVQAVGGSIADSVSPAMAARA